MGQIGLAISVVNGKVEVKMKTQEGTIPDLALIATYLEIIKDQLKAQIIKMSQWKKEE